MGNFAKKNIRERLGRGLANSAWLMTFLNFDLRHLADLFLDHFPLLIDTNRMDR